MTTARPYIAFIASFFVCGFLLYLVGAFYSVSFDLADWSGPARSYVALAALIGGGPLSFFVACFESSRS